MTRYYFDVSDGDRTVVDEVGEEIESFEKACDDSIEVLPELARWKLPDGDDRIFISTIRDASGKQLFKATLAFKCERLS